LRQHSAAPVDIDDLYGFVVASLQPKDIGVFAGDATLDSSIHLIPFPVFPFSRCRFPSPLSVEIMRHEPQQAGARRCNLHGKHDSRSPGITLHCAATSPP